METRQIEGRAREICPACGTVFYQNPLPVAACVVLNDNRQVLLIKRRNDPHREQWCLPIGFAELGETIADAARRELKEETGIDAEPCRLLDTDSFESDFYGDLLIVTFELKKVGGFERAGDDALELRYFPIEALPPLAFSSNEKAVKVCAEAHRDEWAIQDSYRRLHAEEGKELLSDALVQLVTDEAAEVARQWVVEVRSNPTTASYGKVDAGLLREQAFAALSRFRRWLMGTEADAEIRDFYQALGRRRKAQGFSQYEVLSALTLLRRQVWTHARGQGVWERPIDVYRVLELNRRIVLFFDKALYHTVLGFEADRCEEAGQSDD
ncbi:MAG: NUDIX domain-containing protein [Phycisphaerales bacterium]|nr:MAG: NUDIX domain-containing protein [Phycisphaerales bacterium]